LYNIYNIPDIHTVHIFHLILPTLQDFQGWTKYYPPDQRILVVGIGLSFLPRASYDTIFGKKKEGSHYHYLPKSYTSKHMGLEYKQL
jgi:hypothetical protein